MQDFDVNKTLEIRFSPQPSPKESYATYSRKTLHLKEVRVTVKAAHFEINYITEGKQKELIFPKNPPWARPVLNSLHPSPKAL